VRQLGDARQQQHKTEQHVRAAERLVKGAAGHAGINRDGANIGIAGRKTRHRQGNSVAKSLRPPDALALQQIRAALPRQLRRLNVPPLGNLLMIP
jgi:hypothetical protein